MVAVIWNKSVCNTTEKHVTFENLRNIKVTEITISFAYAKR